MQQTGMPLPSVTLEQRTAFQMVGGWDLQPMLKPQVDITSLVFFADPNLL